MVLRFVSGGGNIAIATAYPCHFLFFVLSTSDSLWNFFILFPTLAWGCGFWTWRQTLASGVLLRYGAVCRILYCNVRGLAENLSDLTAASYGCGILLCSETLVSDMRHVSQLLVPGFGLPVLFCHGRMPRIQGRHIYTEKKRGTNWLTVVSPTRTESSYISN